MKITVSAAATSAAQDAVWRALADPTRREILEMLAIRAATTSEFVDCIAPRLVRTAVMKHLDVLESAALIRVERHGRTRHNHLVRKPLERVSGWLELRVHGHRQNLSLLKTLAEQES